MDWSVLTPLVRPRMSSSCRTENKLSSLMFDSPGQRVHTRPLSLSLAGPSKVSGRRAPEVWSGTLCGWPCCDKAAVHNYNRLIEEFLPLEKPLRPEGRELLLLPSHDTDNISSLHSLSLHPGFFLISCHGVYFSPYARVCIFMSLISVTSHWMAVRGLFRHSVTPLPGITEVHLCQKVCLSLSNPLCVISFSLHPLIAVFLDLICWYRGLCSS